MKMSKGLEALHRIANAKNHFKYDTLELVDKDFQIVQQELLRLEALEKGKITDITDNYMAFKNDNAKPSEALKQLGDISYFIMEAYSNHEPLKENQRDSKQCFMNYCSNIKQSLIKSQEQEKILKIIFEKNVDIGLIKNCRTLDEYQYHCPTSQLIPQEFDLLKRYCK